MTLTQPIHLDSDESDEIKRQAMRMHIAFLAKALLLGLLPASWLASARLLQTPELREHYAAALAFHRRASAYFVVLYVVLFFLLIAIAILRVERLLTYWIGSSVLALLLLYFFTLWATIRAAMRARRGQRPLYPNTNSPHRF